MIAQQATGVRGVRLIDAPRCDGGEPDLGVDVRLEYYRVSRSGEQQPVPLSQVIGTLNDRFATEFIGADQLVFDQIEEVLVADEDPAQQARVNTMGNYRFGFDSTFLDAILDRLSQNDGIFTRILDDPAFADAVKAALIARVYERRQERAYPARDGGAAIDAASRTGNPTRITGWSGQRR